MTEQEDDREFKARENRLRRRARRQGLQLVKSRVRDPQASEYGKYRLIEPERNLGIAGYPWALSLDEVETELAALAEWGWTEKRARER